MSLPRDVCGIGLARSCRVFGIEIPSPNLSLIRVDRDRSLLILLAFHKHRKPHAPFRVC